MSIKSLGFIETIGMAAAIEAADTALKSANVELIGYELTKGNGMVTIKIQGDVSAVKSALDAAKYSASRINKVCTTLLIPRPSENVYSMMCCENNKEVTNSTFEPLEEIKNLDLKDDIKEDIKDHIRVDIDVSKEIQSSDLKEDCNLLNEDEKEESQICNICHDPLCTRKKGQSRNLCIHYNEE